METGNIYPPLYTKKNPSHVNLIFKIEKVNPLLNMSREIALNYISVRLN